MNILKTITLALSVLILSACGEDTVVVESGTYHGNIKKVEADKKEIYVELGDNKTIELYFTESTTLSQEGQPADFSALKAGQHVEVTVEKVGNRLDPVSVNIHSGH